MEGWEFDPLKLLGSQGLGFILKFMVQGLGFRV